ncbi:zinc finger protein 700-like [Lampris incognitus]|uniref:zinc finger protein 700-like n=1 Tax=Lampris incognitus TaxID=2546036 RepID=UPI0024B53DEC|nr:zinc finger protein 700-like [Lampris incognitus]
MGILDPSSKNRLSKNVLQKFPVFEVKCPLGLQEPDFLILLKTTFPQLAGDDKPFGIFTINKFRKLEPLKLETLTPENIFKALGPRGGGNTAVYIRLKAGEEDPHHLQLNSNYSFDTTPASATPSLHARSVTNQFKNEESPSRDLQDRNAVQPQQQQQQINYEEEDDNIDGVPDPADSEQNGGEDQRQDDSDEPGDKGDDDWKPNESDEDLKENDYELWSPKTTRKRRIKHRGQVVKRRKSVEMSQEESVKKNNPTQACRVCGTLHGSETILIKHAWSHLEDPGHLCGACGEPAESAKALEDHLQSHQKTHSCHICGKLYLSIIPFRSHVAAHEGIKPYKCGVCCKEFTLKSSFKCHERLHVMNKPHKCDVCHRAFVLKREVESHRRIHMGSKSFSCSVCDPVS